MRDTHRIDGGRRSAMMYMTEGACMEQLADSEIVVFLSKWSGVRMG